MIAPPLLKPKDEVCIVAPAGLVPTNGLRKAVKTLEDWGLTVTLSKNVFSSDGVFSGTDKERLSDFQKALDNPNVKLILAARGGYGFTRYLDQLSYKEFNKYPKWVVGFSDITAFHLAALKNNALSIHGPMGTSFQRNGAKDSIDQLKKLLFKGESIVETKAPQFKLGSSTGELIGGNLSLVCDSLGTSTEIETDDRILVLEDVGDYYYRMDRMLNQLARAGKLSNLKGLVIGDFTELIHGDLTFSESIFDIITRLTSNYNYPIAISMPIGHEPNNYPFVHGATYKIVVEREQARLELLTKL